MSAEPARRYLDDSPASPARFDFDLIGTALAGVLTDSTGGATVVGIHGPWGAGKTTLMYAIRDSLAEPTDGVETVVVEFNAWKYQAREALWRALVLRLVGALRKQGGSDDKLAQLERTLYQAFEVSETGPLSINWRNAATEVASVALEVLQLGFAGRLLRRLAGGKGDGKLDEKDVERIGTVLERRTVSRHLARVESIEQFLGTFEELVGELRDAGKQLVILVDDLDRCLPEGAIEVFEAIKLFLDAPGCGFVVAVDREVIRRGLEVRYAGVKGGDGQPVADADEYIEKTISVSFDVPRLSDEDVDSLIESANLPVALTEEHRELIGKALSHNPRRVKRFLNVLSVHATLAEAAAARGMPAPEPLLAGSDSRDSNLALLLKTMLIAHRYPALLRLGDELRTLFELQTAAAASQHFTSKSAEEVRADRKARVSELPEVARTLAGNGEFWALLEEDPNLSHTDGTKETVSGYVNWFRHSRVDGELGA